MIRFALFGAGFIGTVHAANIVKHPDAELVYVYDANSETAKKAAGRFGGQVATSPEQIWNAKDVDAVLIASSTNTHANLLSQAADAKKAVLCEKPIDLELNRVKDVVTKVVRAGIPVGLGFSRRFDGNHLAVHDAVHSGEVGKLELMHLTSRGPTPPPISYVKVSGGQLRDQTIHFFDLARWIAGDDVVSVYAKGACLIDPAIGEAGDVDTSVVVLTFKRGAICTIDSSRRAAYGYDERIEAFGAKGLVISERKPTANVTHYSADKAIHQGTYAGWFERMEPTFYAELGAFVKALQTKTEPSPSLLDGLKAQLIAEAAVKSLSTGKTEVVEEWQPHLEQVAS
jgi:myo-inositol 2-dehydrogenase / D-chiro-inositol 1-dehydrogenase